MKYPEVYSSTFFPSKNRDAIGEAFTAITNVSLNVYTGVQSKISYCGLSIKSNLINFNSDFMWNPRVDFPFSPETVCLII